jgi:hypothetical protein
VTAAAAPACCLLADADPRKSRTGRDADAALLSVWSGRTLKSVASSNWPFPVKDTTVVTVVCRLIKFAGSLLVKAKEMSMHAAPANVKRANSTTLIVCSCGLRGRPRLLSLPLDELALNRGRRGLFLLLCIAAATTYRTCVQSPTRALPTLCY